MGNPWLIRRTVDLAKETQSVERLCALATTSSRAAHQLRITLKEDGQPVSMTGIAATLQLILPDGGSMAIEGAISGSELTATLPAACYARAGDVKGVLLAKQGTQSAVPVYGFVLLVRADMTDVVLDPTHTIPSLSELLAQLDAAKAATTSANAAASAANTAAGNANAKASLANTAASNANSKASAAQTAADKANAAAQNWESSTAANSNKLGGIAAASYLQKHSLRTMSINIATSAWTGSGPYTATITRSDVTTKTWVDVSLTTASLANYAASIDWSTETAGKIVLTTAVKPTGTIAGTLVLMEVA